MSNGFFDTDVQTFIDSVFGNPVSKGGPEYQIVVNSKLNAKQYVLQDGFTSLVNARTTLSVIREMTDDEEIKCFGLVFMKNELDITQS